MKYLIVILLFISFNTVGESLTEEESVYFNFIDLNNDEKISSQEVDQIFKLIFQLLDKNNDSMITKEEILELKNIVESIP